MDVKITVLVKNVDKATLDDKAYAVAEFANAQFGIATVSVETRNYL